MFIPSDSPPACIPRPKELPWVPTVALAPTPPTPVGFFGITYGRNSYSYYASKRKDYGVVGPLFYYGVKVNVANQYFPITPIFDTNEISIKEIENTIKPNIDINNANIVLPNYDEYFVSSQGLSGAISPQLYKNAILSNESTQDLSTGYKLLFPLSYNHQYGLYGTDIPIEFKFDKPEFYFEFYFSSI